MYEDRKPEQPPIPVNTQYLPLNMKGIKANLSAPTQPKRPPALHRRKLFPVLVYRTKQDVNVLGDIRPGRHKAHQSRLLLFGIHGQPVMLGGLAVEEIWHQDEGVQSRGEEVGALEGLAGQSENVVDVDDTGGSIAGAGDVCLVSFFYFGLG